MAIFSKKEDTRYVKEFDTALDNIDFLGKEFREIHFRSITAFEDNFQKEKSARDLEKERLLFEKHLGVLQKLKHQTDVLLDEALKIVRNETALTERDRDSLHKMMARDAPTRLKMTKKK